MEVGEFFTDGAKVPVHYRNLEIRKDDVDEESRSVALTFSSETQEVERATGIEILDHGKGSARMARINTAAPLLVDHNPGDQVGVIDKASIGDDKRGHAVVRFSKSARGQEIFQDVKDGIRTLVSVGYRVLGVTEPERNARGEASYRVTDWEPYEISLVSIPADTSVGVGRAGDDNASVVRVIPSESATVKQPTTRDKPMSEETKPAVNTEAKLQPDSASETRSSAPESAPAFISDNARVADIRRNELQRVKEIRHLGEKFGFSSEAERALDEGTDAETFRRSITESWEPPIAELDVSVLDKQIGMTNKDRRNWSYLRALQGAKRGKVEGFEKEVSDEAARALGVDVAPNSFVIPADVSINQRDLEAGTDSEGGYGVQTSVGGLIDKLDASLLARMLGAPMLTGLSGNLTLPRTASRTTSSWVDEEGSVSASAPALGQVSLSPKRLATRTIYSDQLLIQNSFSTEQWVRDNQMTTEALAVDLAYFDGTGSSNQPTGITATSGVNAGVTFGGAMTFADWVNIWTELSTAEADGGSPAWVTSAASIAKGLETPKQASGVEGNFIINETVNQQFTVLGLPVYKLGQALTVANQLLLGDFTKAGIASWGARKVVVDPYSLAATGQNVITCNSFYDIFVTQPTAFCKSVDSAAQ